jgi:hypothetical protein
MDRESSRFHQNTDSPDPEQYQYLEEGGKLTPDEIVLGWHWCAEFDGLLVGPGMGELNFCSCLPGNHPVYSTKPPMETGPIDADLF